MISNEERFNLSYRVKIYTYFKKIMIWNLYFSSYYQLNENKIHTCNGIMIMIFFMRISNIYKTGLVMLHLYVYFSKPKKVVMIATHLETCQFYFLPQADNHTFRLKSFCQDCPNFIVNFTHCYF